MDEDDKKYKAPRTDKEIIDEARENLKWAVDTNAEERKRQQDDLKFCTLEQWDSRIRRDRENDPNGARPCLTIDKINQYVSQVENDFRQNPVTGKVRPVSEDADEDAADVFQGAIRNIEDHSMAQVAYVQAGGWAVRCGEGYFRFLTEYKDDKSFKQKIVIKPVADMFSCYLGPHKMPDGSDAPYGFIFEDLKEETFKRLYPKAKQRDAAEFDGLDDYADYWGEKDTVRVAEYFYFEYEPTPIVQLSDGRTMPKSEYSTLPDQSPAPDGMTMLPKPEITDERIAQIKRVKWVKMTGVEILEKRDWAGKYIPIVKVLGKEAWVNGQRHCWGLVRPAKDSLRMYNYWASALTEKLALSPKAPFIGAKGQFSDPRWQRANTENYAALEYDAIDVNGILVPPPKRQEPTQIEAGLMHMFPLIEHDVQTSLGMFKASLGEERPQQSGKAILALTRESDTGTYHFAGNMGISVCHGSRIMIDLIPKIYDAEEVMHMLGDDGSSSQVKLDPKQQMAVQRITDERGKIQKIYNLAIGEYGVTVTVGPSYNTRRMENAALFTDLANSAKDPGSAAVLHYLAVKNSDFDGSREATKAMKVLLPAPVQQAMDKDAPQIPPAAAQRIQQLEQALMQAHQENQQLQSGVAETKMKVDAHKEEAMGKIAVTKQVHEEEMKLKAAQALDEHNLARKKAEDEIALMKYKAALEADAKIEIQRKNAETEMILSREKAELEARTDIRVAEIKADATIEAAGVKAGSDQNVALIGSVADAAAAEVSQPAATKRNQPIERLAEMHAKAMEAHGETLKMVGELVKGVTADRRLVRGPDGRATGLEVVK